MASCRGTRRGFPQAEIKTALVGVWRPKNRNFHNSIRTRQAQNTMREIKCPDGSVAKSHSAFKLEGERYFSELLNQVPEVYQGASEEELRNFLDFVCTPEDCR